MPFADHPASMGHAGHRDRKPACPVCGRPAGTDHACAECGWTLRSARRLGPVTEEMRADFGRRLDAACRLFDAQAAALVSSDPGRLGPWIRGGEPDHREWSAAQQSAVRAIAGATDEAAAIATLTNALRSVPPGAGVTIVEVGPAGVAVTRAAMDQVGAALLDEEHPVRTWPELVPVLATGQDERNFQLAGAIAGFDRDLLEACLADIARLVPSHAASPGGQAFGGGVPGAGEVLVLCQPAGWRVLEDAAGRMLAGLAGARLLRIAGLPGRGNGLLGVLKDQIGLLRAYGVVVAAISSATGAVTLETRPLFSPGDTRGAESVLTLRRAPGDREATTLAIAIGGDATPGGMVTSGAGLNVLSLHSVPLPDQPVYQVRAVLDAPGRVRFTEPQGVTQLSRPWQDVLAVLPDRVDVHDGPVDLICALELAGPKSVVDRRRDLVRDLLSHLASEYPGDGDHLRVGLLGCTDHVFAPGEEGRRVVREKALGPLSDALPALARFEGADIRYQPAAPIEDLLHQADRMFAKNRDVGRAGRLLVVAGRRAHPSKLANLVHPCPFKCDWRVPVRNFSAARVPVLAVVDAMPGRAARAEFWGPVAPAGVRALDQASAPDIAADLGLTVRPGQRIGIPLAG